MKPAMTQATAAQNLFEALAESAPDAILTIDEKSNILFANSATKRIFGYEPEEIIGRPLSILIPERFRSSHGAGVAHYLRTGRRNIPWTGVELPGLRSDGTEVPLEISFGEVRQESGEIIFSGFVRDISERARHREEVMQARADAERALGELRRLGRVVDIPLAQRTYEELLTELLRRLRTELNADAAAVYLLDEDRRALTLRAIDSLSVDLEKDLAIPIGRGIVGEVAATNRPLVLPDISLHEVASPVLAREMRSAAAVPVRGVGDVIGVLQVASRDPHTFDEADLRLFEIVAERMAGVVERTRQFEAEQALSKKLARRAEEERSLRTLAQSITGAVRISEVMHQISEGALSVSDAAGAYVEQVISPTGLVEVVAGAGQFTPNIGQRVPYPGSLTEKIIEQREPAFLKNMEGFGKAMAPYLAESCPHCSVLVVPLLTPTETLGALVLLRKPDEPQFEEAVVNRVRTLADIASLSLQRLVALAESERRRTEAEAAVRTREEVLSIVSHDLRNPVSTVQMSAALLQDPTIELSDEDRRKQVAVISRSAQRMNRLISDLLDVARIEGRRLSISCKCEDIASIASEAVEAFKHIALEKHIDLKCTVADGLKKINADRDRLLQVLSNYLNNAMKFTPEGGTVSLRAQSVADDSRVQIAVSDTGPGIAAEDLPNAFTRFWQARGTAHLGSGLGLAIAKGIAEAHNGSVAVESTPGKGSTFYLEIPYSADCA
jgi:PAS domain S-box-containing protein